MKTNSISRAALTRVCIMFSATLSMTALFVPAASLHGQETWTQWGGDNGRGFSVPDVKLAEKPTLEENWKRDLGSGYSGILVEDDRLYTHYREGNEEVVISLNATDGETVWQHRYDATLPEDANTGFGEGPNSTSMIIGDRLVSIGFLGDMKCFDKATGDVHWETSLVKDHGSTELGFGYSASPLEYDGNIIVPIGGKGKTLMAFSVKDGSVVWSSLDYSISYATPLLVSVDGIDQMILSLTDSVIGVNARDGKELWSFPLKNQWDTHAFVPVWDERKDELFISSFRQSHTLKLTRDGDAMKFEPKWAIEKIGIGFTNAVRLGDVIYGTTGGSRAPLVTAFDLNKGEVLWKERGFGITNLVATGDRLMLLDEKGNLAIANPTDESLNVIFQEKVLDSEKGWTFPTVVEGTLFVRNQKQIASFQLK